MKSNFKVLRSKSVAFHAGSTESTEKIVISPYRLSEEDRKILAFIYGSKLIKFDDSLDWILDDYLLENGSEYEHKVKEIQKAN